MQKKLTIRPVYEDVHKPLPYTVTVIDARVTHGLHPDDTGAYLIGFGPAGEQSIDFTLTEYLDNPDEFDIRGMTATYSKNGTFFTWLVPIEEIKIEEI